MTLDNSGTVSATSTSASGAGVKTIYCGGNNGPVLVINSGIITGNAGGQGGWGLGVETDGSQPMTILNSGSISHNNGLGLAIFASYGTAVISNTGSIYGGLEGISAETFNGAITIYDTGSIQSGGSAIRLGTNNDTVYISGLPTITGTMDGGGGSNSLVFQFNGTLQYVNGTIATQGTNLSAYSLGASGSMLVSGKTYSWANFHVSGSATGCMGSLPPQVTIPLANPGFETRGGGVAIGNTKLSLAALARPATPWMAGWILARPTRTPVLITMGITILPRMPAVMPPFARGEIRAATRLRPPTRCSWETR
jgi:hypothetical protein